MNTIYIHEFFSENCGNGKDAVVFLNEKIKPEIEHKSNDGIILDFSNIKRMNSSFANALFGNFYVLYGIERLKVINLRNDLNIFVYSGLNYGMEMQKEEILKNEGVDERTLLNRFFDKLRLVIEKK